MAHALPKTKMYEVIKGGIMTKLKVLVFLACLVNIGYAQEAPTGSPVQPTDKEQKALNALKGSVNGLIVWSTSRSNSKHDLWLMNADGTDPKQLTKGDAVDWFPRFSPDGSTVLFNRSKGGWVPENDAEYPEKWDLWTIGVDGNNEKKIVDNACWGVWQPDGKSIVFVRRSQVFMKNLETAEEKLLLDGDVAFKKGTVVQQPSLSPDGKYLVATLRGSSRETGVWSFDKKEWTKTGGGCQIQWFPAGSEIYWMNPTGNGGTAAPSEVLAMTLKDGKPVENISSIKKFRLMDLPGRRSHEYFPKFDQFGEYMVWGATDKGHDHDIYDYEIYIWKRGQPVESAVRLTFHSGNDRWPDIFIKK
jgi:Tol biopolymer transport system component